MNWYLKVLKQYADFKGRARRKEFWMFFLFNLLIWMALLVLSSFLTNGSDETDTVITYLLIGHFFIMLIPGLAVTVRRLHDMGKSGSWFFIYFVPVVGGIWLLSLLCTDGVSGPNQYGPDPKNEVSFNEDALDSHLAN
ncbi:hypothetical protein CNR22_19220 [Sphingobacteriaceae bacterium]|nr:hypothetical protein CNR22_19220 [Sphingobacteriaceae bacterium]